MQTMAKRESHLCDSLVEAYSLGKVPESELRAVEEHLLICEACRHRVEESDAYIQGIRKASAQVRTPKRNVLFRVAR
jgi:anti-sigma factor RsiW